MTTVNETLFKELQNRFFAALHMDGVRSLRQYSARAGKPQSMVWEAVHLFRRYPSVWRDIFSYYPALAEYAQEKGLYEYLVTDYRTKRDQLSTN